MESVASQLLFLIQVSRPIVWPVLPLVYILGLRAACAQWNANVVAQLVLLTFPMNLIGCGLNDIYDYDSDRRSTRRRAIWGAVVTPDNQSLVFRACAAMMPLMVFSALLTRNRDNFVATVALVVMAWAYSVPPYRLKERPPLDSLANGLGYFLFPLMMGYSLGGDPRYMPVRYYLLALCVAGVHALATAADYDADRAVGHRTLAVAFGRRSAAALAFAAFFCSRLWGNFESVSVNTYLGVCSLATLVCVFLPRSFVIAASCVTIFVGFLIAAVCHVCGM
ncbi:MAG TPA: UbiA family prenyltransferase [Lacipirellulaceae bacterium]|jgi:4-hydroxybenzoate polyprenyltransferase|nr:UbiA family prenyltransferase [Lacipirellulaceae bacterium]